MIAGISCLFSINFTYLTASLRRNFKKLSPVGKDLGAGLAGTLCGLLGTICYVMTGEESVWGIGVSAFAKLLCIPFTAEFHLELDPPIRKSTDIPYDHSLGDLEGFDKLGPGFFITFFVCKYAACILATATGGPGGIFYPSLLLGGYIGAFIGTGAGGCCLYRSLKA